jgi:hypothetical protein
VAEGVDLSLRATEHPVLAPGQRGVLVSNLAAFRHRYGAGPLVLGTYAATRLNNDGEVIEIRQWDDAVMRRFTYGDGPPWPAAADGPGSSLQQRPGATDLNAAASWQASVIPGGSPGSGGRRWSDWITQQHVPPDVAGLSQDADADGVANVIEFLADTEPTSAASVPQLVPRWRDGRWRIAMELQPSSEEPWQLILQESETLEGWSNSPVAVELGPLLPNGRRSCEWTAAEEGRRFFRLAVVVE